MTIYNRRAKINAIGIYRSKIIFKKKERDKVTENGNRNWTPYLFLRVLAVKKKKYLFHPSEQLKKKKRHF